MNTPKPYRRKKGNTLEKPPKLSPKEYKVYLKETELESVALLSCSAKIRKEYFADSMKNMVSDKVKYEIDNSNNAKLLHEYQFIITKSTKRDFAVKIICEFEVMLISDSTISKDFLDIFSKVNLHMNTWPYFREFVQNIIQRTGLPPLTLPFLKP